MVQPRDTRVLATRLGEAVELHELAAGHLHLDPTTPTCQRASHLVRDFAGGRARTQYKRAMNPMQPVNCL
jgi:hypothetical protein